MVHITVEVIEMYESKIQKNIIDYLRLKGFYTVKTIATNVLGCPDIIACVPKNIKGKKIGLFLAVEVKASEKYKLSEVQKATRNLIESKGGVFIVASKLDDVKQVVEQLLEEK